MIQKKIPEPYTFGDIMIHVAWCYELMADSTDKKFYAEEARGAFATAYQSMKEKVGIAIVP